MLVLCLSALNCIHIQFGGFHDRNQLVKLHENDISCWCVGCLVVVENSVTHSESWVGSELQETFDC